MDGICPSWNAHPIMTVVETISSISNRKLQLSQVSQEIFMASDLKTSLPPEAIFSGKDVGSYCAED
jgi:hypothetical protein